jgi:HlyD family secretion protein
MLLAPGGVLDVSSESLGRLISFTINVGDHVKAGDVVARIDQPDVRLDLANAEAELRDATHEHEQIVGFQRKRGPVLAHSIAQRLRGYNETLAFLEQRLRWLADKAKADEELAAKSLTTRQRVLDTRIEIGKSQEEQVQARNGIRNLEVEASKAEIDDQRERLSSELKMGAAERKIGSLREKLDRQSVVISPYAGIVSELKMNPGEIVERNAALFSLLPNDASATLPQDPSERFGPLYAIIYVAPNEGKKVRRGMQVRVSPSTVRREEFGFIKGRVRAAAEIPSTAEGMNRTLKNRQMVQSLTKEGAPYEIIIDLIADPSTPSGYRWSSSRGPETRIDGGTVASAEVEIESLPVLSLVVPPLRQVLHASTP